MASANPNHSPTPAKFSSELRELAVNFSGKPLSLGSILEAVGERGFHVLLVFASLPFLVPIPLPGLSVPFGLVVTLIGVHFAAGLRPWLPQSLLARQLPPGLLGKVIGSAAKIMEALERVLRPRLVWVHDQFIIRRLAGALVAVSGLYLLAPLPIPFTNTLPAWTILLLAAGALERDGLFLIAGGAAFTVTTAFFALLAFGGMEAVESLGRLIAGR